MIAAGFLALALAQPQEAPREEPRIVVTGERLSDFRDALAACIARNCPPNEDVDATLAVAEAEFLNGDYDRAEDVIRASLGRNRRHAARYPEPVADLWRSQARVQSHRGRDPEALRSTRNILRTLQAGLPEEDHRHFTARFEAADFMMRTGDLPRARRELRSLARAAARGGRSDVARMAEMWLLFTDTATRGLRGPAFRRLAALAESRDPAKQFEAVSARLFLARYYRMRGDVARSDQMLAGIPRGDFDRRQLLFAPPYELRDRQEGGRTRYTTTRVSGNFEDSWIDVSYWIDVAGRVSGVEIVREGSGSGWAQPLLASIRGRRYAPSSDGAPSYRLERYTYTAPFEVLTGSRIPARTGRPRIEFLDLTSPHESGRAPDSAIRPTGN